MGSFVDHPGDETAAGGAPCDPLADAGEVADFLQRPVDFLVDPLHPAIKFRLCRIAPFDRRKDIIHIHCIAVTVDDSDCFVGQDHTGLFIEFRPVLDNYIVLYPIPCQQAYVDGRHSAGIVAEQEQIEIKRFLLLSPDRSNVSILRMISGDTPLGVTRHGFSFACRGRNAFGLTL